MFHLFTYPNLGELKALYKKPKINLRGLSMSNKEKPHKKLNWKCSKCKERYNLEELEELGYVERIGNSMVIECPSCENQELIKRN